MKVNLIPTNFSIRSGYLRKFILSGTVGGYMEVRRGGRHALKVSQSGHFTPDETSLALDWIAEVVETFRYEAGKKQ